MTAAALKNITVKFEKAGQTQKKYVLCLYIAGMTLRSRHAVMNIKKICEDYLKGRYELEIVDIRQSPSLAKKEQILAVPILIKTWPLPARKFIGDLSETDRILSGLDLSGEVDLLCDSRASITK